MVVRSNALESAVRTADLSTMKKTPDMLTGNIAASAAATAWSNAVENRLRRGLPAYGVRDGVLVKVETSGAVIPVSEAELAEASRALASPPDVTAEINAPQPVGVKHELDKTKSRRRAS
jgi:hypothetical protein